MDDTVRKLLQLLLSWEPFDPDACGRVARWTAVFCVVAVTVAMAILLIDKDGTRSCPGWHLAQGREGSVWVAVIFSSTLAAWMCCVAIFWKYFSRKMALDEQALPLHAMVPMNSVFVGVAIGWCGFCSFPLVMLLVSCVDWLG